MRKEFVRTENDKRFRDALTQLGQRGAAESGLIVVHGRAGEGKTRTLYNWASGCNAVMVTGYPGWTPRRMLMAIAQKMGIVVHGAWEQEIEDRIAAEEIAVIVDEAGFAMADGAACVERLRVITDKSGTPLVMVMMERDMPRLLRHDQITSRATLCPFRTATLADVRSACSQLAEVAIAADLVERIHRDSGARMRLVIEAINVIERVALAGGKTAACAADLSGWALCEDFSHALQRSATARTKGGRA
jgi:hypothetical protein